MKDKIQEQEERDVRLHLALYGPWDETRCPVCGWPLKEQPNDGCVTGNCSMRPLPQRRADQPTRFHHSQDAKLALLKWLGKDDTRWMHFEGEMDQILGTTTLDPRNFRIRRSFMLATPSQIAEAADKTISIGCPDSEKKS
jgi:hypothetical protein